MKKQFLAFLLIAALALGMLAGCNKEETPTPEVITYTITLAHDFEGKSAEVLNTYLAKFSETFPHITVETMKTADITDENRPNVLICLPEQIGELVSKDSLVPLTSLVDADSMMLRADGTLAPMNISLEQQSDMYDIFYEEGFIGEDLYALPLAKDVSLLYYNQTFFDENELDLPTNWDEMELLCEQLKALDPTCIPLCIDDESSFLISLFAQHQGGYFTEDGTCDFNSETNRELAKMLNDWYQKGYITTRTLMNRENVSSLNAEDTKHYMVIGAASEASANAPALDAEAYAFELGIFAIPRPDYENRKILTRGPSLSILKNDDDEVINCAWMLILYLSTDIDFQARFAEASGMQPVMDSVYIEDQYTNYLNQADGASNAAALAALVCMDQQSAQFTAPIFDGAATAYTQMGDLLNKCLTITGEDVAAQIEAAFLEAENACK